MAICANCLERLEHEVMYCPHCGHSEDAPRDNLVYLPLKSELKGRYAVGRILGSGSFGVTYLGWDNIENRKVAIKEYMPSEFATRVSGDETVIVFQDEKKQKQYHDGLVKFVEEGEKLVKLPANNGIVKVYDCFSANKTAYIVMEYLTGVTLAHILENNQSLFTPEQAMHILMPVALSMQLAHSEGLVHGDITPSNILLTDDGLTKLIDFSSARFATTSHSRSLSVLVSSGYSPEEQYRSTGDHGPHTDVYALGAVFYRLINGSHPPDALERRMNLERNKKEIISPLKGFPQANAIMNALNVRIEDRTPDMALFSDELYSPVPVKRRGNRISRLDFGRLSKKAIAAICLSFAAICTIGTLFALGFFDFGSETVLVPDGMTIVPYVINLHQDRAEIVLRDSYLNDEFSGSDYSNVIPESYVFEQSVPAGSLVDVNTTVVLAISLGPNMIEVPGELVGKDAADVMDILDELGFIVRQEARFSQVFPEGIVVGITDSDGISLVFEEGSDNDENQGDGQANARDRAHGSTINIFVSQGPHVQLGAFMETVPDFVGKSMQEILNLATQEDLAAQEPQYDPRDGFFKGFFFEVASSEYHSTIPAGQVISQSPAAGLREMNGIDNPVQLVISLGREMTRVPNLYLASEDDARSQLQAVGLSPSISHENHPSIRRGLVISQNPAAGTSVEPGSPVAIVVSVGEPDFAVPNVVGRSEADARRILEDSRLVVEVSRQFSSTPAGQVLRQSPAPPAMIGRGDTVVITISSGEETFEVPNVVGASRSSAETSLQGRHFVVFVTTVHHSTVAEGHVISQSPSAGTQQLRGVMVTINVSLGQPPVEVPSLVNMQQAAAETRLRNLGLVPNVEAVFDDDVARGLVISQSPSARSQVRSGSSVTIKVSLGPRNPTPVVEDVTRYDRSSAESILRAQGFSVKVEYAHHRSIPEGSVIRQNPIGGSTLREGGTVEITVSLGPEMVTVPNLIGQSESSARSTLDGLGLHISVSTRENPAAAGTVFEQSPAQGTQVAAGSRVTISVSMGQTVSIPNVRDVTASSARSTLQGQPYGFSVTETRESSSDIAEGRVIRTEPSAGTNVSPGSAVRIVISAGPDIVMVSVPNVSGQTESSARQSLQAQPYGFTVTTGTPESSSTVEEGRVIRTVPSAGSSVTQGSSVQIIVSTGPEVVMVTVPNVRNERENSARSILQGSPYDFTVTTGTPESSSDVEEGHVIRTVPSAGSSVTQGSTVQIIVSTGPEVVLVTVPNVMGQSENSARETLENAGFSVSLIMDDISGEYRSEVTSQDPSSGTQRPADSMVTITVSILEVRIPSNIQDMTEQQARSALVSRGFTVQPQVNEVESFLPAGSIIVFTAIPGETPRMLPPGEFFTYKAPLSISISIGP